MTGPSAGPPRWLFWHRRDLRLADNLGLAAAAAATPAVTGVFVLDPAILGPGPGSAHPPMAPARLWFLRESLRELQRAWRAAGSRLLLLEGDPVALLPRLAAAIAAETVVWNRDVEPAGRERDRRVAAALQADGRRLLVDWDQLLVPPGTLRTGAGDPYRVYGPYRRRWFRELDGRRDRGGADRGGLDPLPAPQQLHDLAADDPDVAEALTGLPLVEPDSIEHGFAGVDRCPCRPGEAAARDQLRRFCDGGGLVPGGRGRAPLLTYEPDRNLPGTPGTSALSAALKFGTLSPRQAWQASEEALQQARGEEARASVAVWRQELAWREFYQQALFHHPELAAGPYRPQWRHFPWENDPARLQAWCEGRTGVPIVDAAMRQLNESGWMHNRCRMIVASYLVKDLICDWRLGEKAFMERLVDGDLAANNGGWQWSASSGMDPKPLRIFNPATQAAKFDPEAVYIRAWLPELAHVATGELLAGTIPAAERGPYPEPLVNHREQQARFKALYARIR